MDRDVNRGLSRDRPAWAAREVDGTKVEQLNTAIAATDDVWAVDPWLNVFCNMTDYGDAAAAKFKKWQKANKRVYWNDGPLGKGWYAPLGDYSQDFAGAALKVELVEK